MADYTFVRCDGIDGTSKQTGFEKHLEIDSFSHMCDYAVSPGDLASAGTRVSHTPFTLTRRVDKATPEFMNHLNQRLAMRKVELTVLTDDVGLGGNSGGKKVMYKVTLEDCRIVNVSISGVDSEGMPIETLSIAYNKISWWFDEAVSDHSFRDWAAGA